MAQMAQPCSVAIYYFLRLGSGGMLPIEFVTGPLREDGASAANLILCCASGLLPTDEAPAVDPDSYEEGERSEENTSELQSLMRISYDVFCMKKKKKHTLN